MARREVVICEACKKEWNARDEMGAQRFWERSVKLAYEGDREFGGDHADMKAEVCQECAGKALWALECVKRFLRGESNALEEISDTNSSGGPPVTREEIEAVAGAFRDTEGVG